MKTSITRRALQGCALALLSLVSLAPSQAQEGDYYIVDGQRVALPRSPVYEAVEVKPGRMAAFSAAAGRNPGVTVEPAPILQRYDVVLLRKKESATPGAFGAGMGALRADASVESTVPVYKLGGIDQVLVNEFLVQFKADTTKSAAETYLRNQGAEVVVSPGNIANRYTIRFPDKSSREALKVVNDMTNDAPVQFAEPNFIRLVPKRPLPGTPAPQSTGGPGAAAASPGVGPAAPVVPNDTVFGTQWALRNNGSPGVAGADINATSGWEISKGSNQVTIAILDEGVDVNHPDLQSKIVTPYDATDGDNDQQPKDWDGHGTSCAGIAAAVSNNGVGVAGVSWEARIMPVRIAYSDHAGGPWLTSNAIIEDAIRTAVDRGAKVLSNSWGGGSPSSAINAGFDYAIANNRVVVVAAGNDDGPVSYPATLSTSRTLIAVSATNEWDQLKTLTSQDGENWWGSNFGPQINVSAPGVHIQTTDIHGAAGYTNGDYVSNFNGTSSATPLVAGAAAVVLAVAPMATTAQVRQWLQTGDDLGPPGFDNQFGHARLDLRKALVAAGGVVAVPPGPTVVALTIVQPNSRLAKGSLKAATAKVTSGGSPVAGATVAFASSNTAWASVTPASAITDGAGNAQAQIRGETGSKHTAEITATANGVTDTKPVKVPALPLWTVAFAGLLLLGAHAWRRLRQ